MDPFIESDNWQDFHLVLTAEMKRQLAPQLPSYYRLSAELVVQEDEDFPRQDEPETYRPDVSVSLTDPSTTTLQDAGDTAVLTAPTHKGMAPLYRQRELRIRDGRNRRLVTAIEVLSPSNKRSGGIATHMKKLRSYWASGVHTVDIDLLRGGVPPYTIEEVPVDDDDRPLTPYRIVQVRPDDELLRWDIALTDPLPTIPIPLSHPDPPVVLNLQRAFTDLYVYSTYPPRGEEELAGVRPSLTEKEVELLRTYL
jgi:hypothetical protein